MAASPSFYHHHQQNQQEHHCSLPCSHGNVCVVSAAAPSSPARSLSAHQFARFYEADISSPTSWEFRCQSRGGSAPKHYQYSQHSHQISGNHQIMLRSPPPAYLHLNLSPPPPNNGVAIAAGGGSTSSQASSLSTTPSPLEEHIPPTAHMHIPQQHSYYQAIHFGGGSVSGCGCASVSLGPGDAGGGQDPLDLSEGSRTSTGSSQRSQDSGFSDAGETKKERRILSQSQYQSPLPPPPLPSYSAPATPGESPDGNGTDQIYEIVAPMPSPIPASGFGCGRFQQLAPPTQPPCIDCLSCSVLSRPDSTPLIPLPLLSSASRQRRSFSPSALASASTHTALAALRVPLSSSTPKRPSSQSSSRLCNRIDNFESLNKNAAMNKDNNNNSGSNASSSSGSASTTTKNHKTFTVAPSTSNASSYLSQNGTVLAEELASRVGSSTERQGASSTKPKRSAAESIYDKICHRLSSLSSSVSGSATPPPTTVPAPAASTSSQPPAPTSSKFAKVLPRPKCYSLPRGIGAPTSFHQECPTPRGNTSAPPAHILLEEEYHEERPIDVPVPPTSTPSPSTPLPETDSPVVLLWLKDLRTQYEPECLHSLQNKWILPYSEEGSSPYPPSSSSPTTSSRKISSSSGASSSSIPNSATSSYARRVRQHQERRSQQRFLTSMTAAIHAVSTPLMSIRTVEMTASVISAEFSKICKHLEFGVFTQVPTLVMSLVGHIQDFLRGVQSPSPATLYPVEHGNGTGLLGPSVFGVDHLMKLEGRLEDACFALNMAVKGIMGGGGMQTGNSSGASSSSQFLEGDQYQQIIGDVVEGIVTVGNLFSEVVDLRLTRDLGSILDTVEAGGIPARVALKSLVTVLAEGGNHICRLAADIRTVRGLLGVMLDTREDQDKILALRCLATVLCVGEAVRDFDKAGGFEIIADLLNDSRQSLCLKMEAVAVLTQATDPWIDLESTLVTLGMHLKPFILALTNLVQQVATEEEHFLLVVAAISNLTFLEVSSTEYLNSCGTVNHLISAVRSKTFSVFVLDHVATILANMAGMEGCRGDIITAGGIDCLLQFLQQKPASAPGQASQAPAMSAITACERLQQKSTIALSRLANEEGVARYVLQRGGLHRLVTLCRREKERNYSDGVLIAALATLRKLVSLCGGQEALLQNYLQGAEDLLQPRLLDSFLLYSSRQESYV